MENIEYKGYTIEIKQDEFAENPRDPNYQDNFGILLTAHKNYSIGEVDIQKKYPDAENWQDIEKAIKDEYNPVIMLPVYMYDHSIQRFKIGSFQGYLPEGHAEFDSGKIGYIIAEKDKIKKEYDVKRISKKLKDQITEILQQEIKQLDQWSCGDVYGYNIEETGDSCWGFYGYDYTLEQAKETVDYRVKTQREKKQKTLKSLIKNHIPLIYREAKLA